MGMAKRLRKHGKGKGKKLHKEDNGPKYVVYAVLLFLFLTMIPFFV